MRLAGTTCSQGGVPGVDGTDRGWTVFEKPSIPGSCHPLDRNCAVLIGEVCRPRQPGAAARELNGTSRQRHAAMVVAGRSESQVRCAYRARWTTPARGCEGDSPPLSWRKASPRALCLLWGRRLVPRRRREQGLFLLLQVPSKWRSTLQDQITVAACATAAMA